MTAWAARVRPHAPALAVFAVLTIVVLWPAVAHFTSRPMIGAGDSSIFYWAWWHGPRALGEGDDPFRTADLMFPVGVDLRTTVTAPGLSAVTYPIRAWLGPEAQVNAAQLLSAFTSAIAAYFLAHRVWRDRAAATIAGAAFAFTSYRFVHQPGHLNLIMTGVIPLSVLLFLRMLEAPSARRAAALGASIGAAVLFDPQLAVMAVLALVPFAISGRAALRRSLGAIGIVLAAAAVVGALVWLPLAQAIVEGESSDPPAARELTSTSASPFAWVVPPKAHPVLGDLAEIDVLSTSPEGVAYPGLSILALVVVGGALCRGGERRGWVMLLVLGFLLSLGPFLTIGGRWMPLPLPYLVLRAIPFMDTFRAPGRLALIGVLAAVVLAAGAIRELTRRWPARRWLVLSAVSVVLAFELLPGPLVSRPGGAPEPYSAIAADEGRGAVLEVPLQWSTGVDVIGDTSNDLHVALFMAWATVHERPYVGGSLSRYSDERLQRLFDIPVYRQILAMQDEPGIDDPASFGADDLSDLGIGYVVYHRSLREPRVYEHLDGLDLPVLADDGDTIVWKVPHTTS